MNREHIVILLFFHLILLLFLVFSKEKEQKLATTVTYVNDKNATTIKALFFLSFYLWFKTSVTYGSGYKWTQSVCETKKQINNCNNGNNNEIRKRKIIQINIITLHKVMKYDRNSIRRHVRN